MTIHFGEVCNTNNKLTCLRLLATSMSNIFQEGCNETKWTSTWNSTPW
jgi:hypothetical protein